MGATAKRRAGGARCALAAGCVALVLLLAWLVLGSGALVPFDLRVTHWLAAHRLPGLTTAMLLVSEVHRTLAVLAMAAAVAGWLLWRRRRGAALALLAIPGGMLLNVGLKHVFQRARPVLEEPLVHLSTYSFPSGHAVASTVLYGTLCTIALASLQRRGTRAAAVALAAGMVLVVCFSRVYLGAHYLTDVTAGVVVGVAWLAALRPWMRLTKEEEEEKE